MKIRAGFDISFEVTQSTPMIVMLTVHPSRAANLLSDHRIDVSPRAITRDYLDQFGNICTRLEAPPGGVRLQSEFLISDCGLPDEINFCAAEIPIERLPDDVLVYLVPSRYCDTEKVTDLAWSENRSPVGAAYKKSATMFTTEYLSATSMPARTVPPLRATMKGSGSAAILHIWLSPFAAA
jgi:hypothetical protein